MTHVLDADGNRVSGDTLHDELAGICDTVEEQLVIDNENEEWIWPAVMAR